MKFQEFLDQVLPDKADQMVLQTFVGWNNPMIKIRFCGFGATGKSTMFRIITAVFPQFLNRIDHLNECSKEINALYFTKIIPANGMIFDLPDQIVRNDKDAILEWAKDGSKLTAGDLSEAVLNSIIGE